MLSQSNGNTKKLLEDKVEECMPEASEFVVFLASFGIDMNENIGIGQKEGNIVEKLRSTWPEKVCITIVQCLDIWTITPSPPSSSSQSPS